MSLTTAFALALGLILADPGQTVANLAADSEQSLDRSRSASSLDAPILLNFHSARCGPCLQVRPEIQRLVNNRYPVRSIEIGEHPEWARRFGVESVPTFIVVTPEGRELGRTSGYQPAERLAAFYRAARKEWSERQALIERRGSDDELEPAPATPRNQSDRPRVVPISNETAVAQTGPDPSSESSSGNAASSFRNPKPWQTVVRIQVHIPAGPGTPAAVGNGSGTIIHSDDDEAIILTCAHIFELEGGRRQRFVKPSQFPYPITVDLFDGVLHGLNPAQVHKTQTLPGEVIDYEPTKDVGLVRIRPKRRLPASRVVPKTWVPTVNQEMITVGCSEGNDATAWSTSIRSTKSPRFPDNPLYEGLICQHAPRQGRSGGGLFTLDGFVAGVCDFAEYQGNVGFYATPRSIHMILDRNNLSHLYKTLEFDAPLQLAGNTPGSRDVPQSEHRRARANRPDTFEVSIPSPELLGIAAPRLEQERDPFVPDRRPLRIAANDRTRERLDERPERESEWRVIGPEDSPERLNRAGTYATDMTLDSSAVAPPLPSAPRPPRRWEVDDSIFDSPANPESRREERRSSRKASRIELPPSIEDDWKPAPVPWPGGSR